jgi:hypothetical protein
MRVNTARVRRVKSLQRRKDEVAGARGRERGCRLDKLGVTGSSPVPPIESPCKSLTSVFRSETGIVAVLPAGEPEATMPHGSADRDEGVLPAAADTRLARFSV